MDRPVRIRLPSGDSTRYAYGFGIRQGKTYFRSAVTDANGRTFTTLLDSRRLPVVKRTPDRATTTFSHNPLGMLSQTTDPDGLSTFYSYDMLGRLVRRIHPDAGADKYAYDPAGNMVHHVDGNGDSTLYNYHYNLLTDIHYPSHPVNDVHYVYGSADAVFNRAGKVVLVEDASGWQVFSYGKLGEVTETIRTFTLPYENQPYSFRMQYTYDSHNRIQSMTYPDGEVVSYVYDRGGLLKGMGGEKDGYSHHYIDSIRYNVFGLKESVRYGNGTQAQYHYDLLQRLDTVRSWDSFGNALQDIAYTYDPVGNITDIVNDAPMLAAGLGGPYVSHYSYDWQYRLDSAWGYWQSEPDHPFHLGMSYTLNGRMTRKTTNAHALDANGNTSSVQYARQYLYHTGSDKLYRMEEGPHASPSGLHVFSWDAAGNMTSRNDIISGHWQSFCWEEDNRLAAFASTDRTAFYQYDCGGERTYKLVGESLIQVLNGRAVRYNTLSEPTLYASPYVVCTPKGYTKHYYAESERVASRIGGGGLSDLCRAVNPTADYDYPEMLPHRHMGDSIPINPGDIPSPPLFVNPYFIECGDSMPALGRKCAEGEKHIERLFQGCQDMLVRATHPLDSLAGWRVLRHECEPDCYWYHTDHLGSSSWITHTNGQAVQHLHYLPWGEGFVDQRATDHAARYTFSAKEKDSESGLYYYGARYYDPDLGIWLSVDPMASKYPSFSPYAFCGDNPVKFVDLEGEEIVIEWKGSQYRYEKDGTLTHFKGGILNERQQNRFVNKAKNALDKINKTTEGNRMISDLQESDTRYTIKAGASGYEKTEANTITWNPNGTRLPVEGTPFGESNSTCDLAHELSHAFDDNNNWTDNTSVGDLNKNEWVACYRENHIRKESGYGYRTHYISGFTKDGHFQGGEGSTLLNDNGPYLPFDIKSYEKRK